ncbi:hypothetical protein Esti_001610 [Eimeria stiedai]
MRRLVRLYLLFSALAVQWPAPQTVETYGRADGVGVDVFGEPTSKYSSFSFDEKAPLDSGVMLQHALLYFFSDFCFLQGSAHPHLLFQSASSLLSFVDLAATTNSSTAEHCPANSSSCQSHQSEGENASFFGVEGGGRTHAVKLKHANNIPELGFLQWKDGQRSNRQQVPSEALQQAVKQAYYAYPLYEDNTFKMHVHRRGQKQLISDLHQAGVFDLHADEAARDEWSLMQSVAQSYTNDAEGDPDPWKWLVATLAPRTYSTAQTSLDFQCQTLLQVEGRAVARVVDGEVYCFKMTDVDLNRDGRCLDACLFEFSCPGQPNAQAQKVKLDFSKSAMLRHTCTTSRIQSMASQHFCGDSSVLRMTDEEPQSWVCIAPDREVQIVPSLKCFDHCGSLTSCLSPLGPVVLSGKGEVAMAFAMSVRPSTCTCSELGRGPEYTGCQAKTRLGKTCQNWNSQSPHKHEYLLEENHNFCRAPDGGSIIWCFTTDPEVRSDYCDPLGARTQVVHPGEVFDLVLEGHFGSPDLEVAFFAAPENTKDVCGKGKRTNAITLQLAPNSRMHEVKQQGTQGKLSALIWEGASVASTASGTYAVCLCSYTYFLARTNLCHNDSDFTWQGGWLYVKGPIDPFVSFEFETGKPSSFTLEGHGYDLADSISIMQTPYECDSSALRFAEALSSLLRSGLEAEQMLKKAIGFGTALSAKVSPVQVVAAKDRVRMTLPDFTLYRTGTYTICWASADGICSAYAGSITVSGLELRRQFYALYVPTSSGLNNRPFPIFIAARGEMEVPSQSSIYLTKAGNGNPCTGAVVGRPRTVALYSTNPEADERVFVAEHINLDNLSDESETSTTRLEVCLDKNQETTLLGYATAGYALIYPLAILQVSEFGSLGVPKSVHAISIPVYSSLGLHWSDADTACFYEKDLIHFFTQRDEYPIALSFWVDSNKITVWHSSFSMPAPKAFARFETSDALAVAVNANTEGVVFYLTRENPARLEKYDMTAPTHLSSLKPVATTDGSLLLSNPSALAILEGEHEVLLVVLDTRANKAMLFDGDLNLIESRSTWEGMSRPLAKPKGIYCINTPHSWGEEQREGLFDCYLTDVDNQRLLLIQYDTSTRTSSFITQVPSAEESNRQLVDPHGVVAYPYNGFTLIYVAEAGRSQPMLLTKGDDQDEVRLIQRLEVQSYGELDMLGIGLLQTGEATDGLDSVWLLSFHGSFDSPTVHVIPLDTTATAPDFKYTPREWYALGEEHTLEPSLVGEGSYSGLTGFAFNTAAHSYSFMERNITINRKTGVLTLRIIDIPENVVTVEITGTGIVNSVKTTFSFRVGCRDGHYYNQGMCVKCQTGTFNSLALVRESPSAYFHSCRSCGERRTTVAGGSTSSEQCLCGKGYYEDETSGTNECVACPAGTYKDIVSNTGCTGGGCPQFSVSHIQGAISSEDRKCSCLPGYYAVYTQNSLECRAAEVGYFSLGGYNAERIECPPFTSTDPERGLAVDMTFCLCQPGYAPAQEVALQDPDSPASALKRWILLNPKYAGLQDSQVCMLCGRRAYKGRVSAEPCTECPLNSFSSDDGPTNKTSCNMCIAGYYLTANEDIPCGECQANHFCVGSEPASEALEAFAGENTPCLDNTTTIEPYNKNSDPFSCMCTAGFEYVGIDAYTGKVMCEPARLGVYKDTLGNISGTQCPHGSFTLATGSTSLADCVCSAGFYLDEKSRTCKSCPIGAYCLGGLDPETHWHRSYEACPVHTTTKNKNSTSIDDCLCDKGFYKTTTGAGGKACVQCEINSYKDWIGSEACKQCSENSGTIVTGSTSSAQCLCQAGYYYSDALRECIACKNPFKYCPGGEMDCSEEDTDCVGGKKPIQPLDCPLHTRITEGFDTPSALDDCKCEKGYAFRRIDLELNTKICEPCNEGSYKSTVQDINCNGLCGTSSTSLAGAQAQVQCFCEEGFYFTSGACHSCPDGAVCKGGLRESAIEAMQKDPSYLGLLVSNIAMAYMNVAAGFNRRSIHSIVIKIASNFFTCMSVLGAVDFDTIALPSWLESLTNTVSETITQKGGSSRMMAVECLLREGFSLSFADSFFYTMLFYALLPVSMPFVVTFILYFLVRRFQHYSKPGIKKKLRLLEETEKYGLTNLTEQLREKYEEDRAFMMFRYIPIPGDSYWRRLSKFLEDMIPIYVTVVFFLYTATTRHMLSLLDCTAIDFGAAHGFRYYLRAAMSVECEVDPSKEYFKFFALGIVGILLWSIGIPLAAFFVLYANRKRLNSRENRLKFGFLHNGFVKKYWYWETVVFARKFAVLVVSSIHITSSDSNGSKLWPACVTAVMFNIYHLRSQPFDKRSYSTLDILENHSMSIWTLAVCLMLAITGSNFSGNVNFALAVPILVAMLLFGLEVAINLLYAYFDNVRANRSFFNVPVIGYLFRAFARWSEKRKTWEPLVVYDVDNDVIQLVAAKRSGRLKISKIRSSEKINSKERQYFLKVMAETLGFAVVHMKLDVIPGTFLEFVLRLGFAFHKLDEDSQENKKSLQAIAGGDISMLADWSRQQKRALQRRKEALKDVVRAEESMEGFFKEVEKKVAGREATTDSEEEERLRDIEGGLSGSELDDIFNEDEEEQEELNIEESRVDHLIAELSGEEQAEATYIFDNNVMGHGIPLSELYLALLKLQRKDAMSISHQYEIFKAKKAAYTTHLAESLRARNKKLKLISYVLQAANEGAADGDIASLGFTPEALQSLKQLLDEMMMKQNLMKQTLQRLQADPETYQGEDLELEWISEAGQEQTEPEQQEDQPAAEVGSEPSADLDSDDSDPEAKAAGVKVIGYDCEDWAEDDV